MTDWIVCHTDDATVNQCWFVIDTESWTVVGFPTERNDEFQHFFTTRANLMQTAGQRAIDGLIGEVE